MSPSRPRHIIPPKAPITPAPIPTAHNLASPVALAPASPLLLLVDLGLLPDPILGAAPSAPLPPFEPVEPVPPEDPPSPPGIPEDVAMTEEVDEDMDEA